MPRCDLVITHGGHGTLARALASGCPVLVCPAGGDMAENAARVDWAGVGVRLAPRFCTPWGVRLAVRRALRVRRCASGRRSSPRWAFANPGPATAATQLERWAATMRVASRAPAGVGVAASSASARVRRRAGPRRVPVRPGVAPSPGSV